jgi:invasion protein IalB
VLVLNRIVLKRAPVAALALLTMALPSEAQTARAAGQKPPLPALAQTAKQPPAAAARLGRAAYTSADVACTTGRKRLWTETGWMVRRVTSCR